MGPEEAIGFIEEGYPVIVADRDGSFTLIDSLTGKHLETTRIGEHVVREPMRKVKLGQLLQRHDGNRVFVAKKDLGMQLFFFRD